LAFYLPCVPKCEDHAHTDNAGTNVHIEKIKKDIATCPYNTWTSDDTWITDMIKELVILPFVQQNNLAVDISYEVLDQFFTFHNDKIHLFNEFEKKIKLFEEKLKELTFQMGQPLQGHVDQLARSRLESSYKETSEMYERYIQELRKHAKIIGNEAHLFYF